MTAKNDGMIQRSKINHLFSHMAEDRFIFVSAPSGFGKTIAVRQWLESIKCMKSSLMLDEYDNNLPYFCERFCAMLCDNQPLNSVLTEIVKHPAFSSAPDEFTLRAVDSLESSSHSIFVIDDLHFVNDERVLRLMLLALKRFPKSFQIILISRSDLPAGFSELMMKDRLSFITAEQLRFNDDEIMLLCKKRGVSVTPEQAEHINQYTHGWAIGINTVLLSGSTPSGTNLDYLDNFIRSNVWEKWDEQWREFMINTAAARKLEPSLCTALTGITESKQLLKKLMLGGAFITLGKDGIFQYHNLFHKFLEDMLAERGEEYLFSLLEKEGWWHLSQGDSFSAIECFVRCNNLKGFIASFLEISGSNRKDFVIERLLPIIHTGLFFEVANEIPHLFSALAWAAFASGRAGDMESHADQFYARFPEIIEQTPDRARYLFLMYFIDYRVSLSQLVEAASSMPILPDQKGAEASSSMNMPLLHRCTRDFSEISGEDCEANVTKMKGLIGWLFGDEAELLADCLKAGLLYERSELEKAHLYAAAAVAKIKEHFAPESKFCAFCIYTYVLDALGLLSDADRVVNDISEMIEQDRAYYLNRNFNAIKTRRLLQNGNMDAAKQWIGVNGVMLYGSLRFYTIYEEFTTCRAYIAYGDYDTAIILLNKVLELAISYKRPLDIVEARILLAISYWKKKRGFQREAIKLMEEAVASAYSYGYTQLFANEGAELAGMVNRMIGRAGQLSHENMVPVSFIKLISHRISDNTNTGLTSGQLNPIEKYTDKQKKVMKLLCEGKSYREITEIMGVKLPTLRSHISLIYKKLDVTRETDAVKKIKTLGLLDEI